MPNGRDVEFLAGFHDRVADDVLIGEGMVQLPAELADEIDAQRPHRRTADGDVLAGEPRESLVREIGVGDLLHAGRATSGRRPPARRWPGSRCRAHAVVGRQVAPEQVPVMPVRRGGADDIEAVLGEPRDGEFASARRPCGVSTWARAMRPIFFGRRLATSRSRNASAPVPDTSNFEKPVRSSRPTRSRTARHSSRTGSKKLVRRKLYLSFVLALRGANQLARSQPNFWPNTAPSAFWRS